MNTPLFGISGFKNSGKTTLTAKLIAEFCSRGLRVSSVKHAHHEFDLDQPGTDTDQHRSAGASEVVIASSKRWALMHENTGAEKEPTLAELTGHMAPCDLIIAEGYKRETHPKLLLLGKTDDVQLIESIENVVAIAAEPELDLDEQIQRFDRNNVRQIADFIESYLALPDRSSG